MSQVAVAESARSEASAGRGEAFVCWRCGRCVAGDIRLTGCPSCGVPYSPRLPHFDAASIDGRYRSVRRYASALPLDGAEPVCLGEGCTPLLGASAGGQPVLVKLEFLQPTGSYKDRGSAVLAAAFARAGARRAVEDSSGNAGASLAAYLGRAGIALELFVPSRLSPGALGQAAAYGARVDREASDRDHAAERAMARVSEDAPYASHVTSPYFMAGVATMAFEIWEDLGRAAPDVLVVPVGQGVLALGLHYGFESLAQAGLIDRAPRIVGVQAVACAPLAAAFQEQVAEPAPITAGETRAFGVKVARPRRGAEVLAAVRATRGEIVTVTEEAIEAARRRLGREGWYVEPTGAVGMAGAEQIAGRLRPSDTVVVPLTGSGLKTMANGREGQGGLS